MTPEQEKAEREHCVTVATELRQNRMMRVEPTDVAILLRERAAARAETRRETSEAFESVSDANQKLLRELAESERRIQELEGLKKQAYHERDMYARERDTHMEVSQLASIRVRELEGQYAAACWDRKCLRRDMDVLQEKYDADVATKDARIQELEAALMGVTAAKQNLEYQYQTDVAAARERGRLEGFELAAERNLETVADNDEVRAKLASLQSKYDADVAAAEERGRAEGWNMREQNTAMLVEAAREEGRAEGEADTKGLLTPAALQMYKMMLLREPDYRELQSKYDADVAAAREQGLVEGYIKHAHPEFLKLQSKHEALVAAARAFELEFGPPEHEVTQACFDLRAALAGEPKDPEHA